MAPSCFNNQDRDIKVRKKEGCVGAEQSRDKPAMGHPWQGEEATD